MSRIDQCLKKRCYLLGMVVLVGFMTLSYYYIDRSLASWLYCLNLSDRFPFLTLITHLGNSTFYLIFFLSSAFFFRYIHVNSRWEARSWFLWLCVLLSNGVCGILKIALGRARPQLWLQSQEYGFSWLKMDSLHRSFPSGHTTTIMSIAFGLSILFPRYRFWLILAGVLVSGSRVLLLEHYLSDVVTALVLTWFTVAGLVNVLRKKGWLLQIWETS